MESSKLNLQERNQILLQINFNIPILILACFDLYRTTINQNIDNFLFSGRDCFFMELIFKKLAEGADWPVTSHYFLTSRIARLKASVSYLKYFQSLCTKNTAVVDLCGTGWSLSNLYDQANINPLTYLVHYTRNNQIMKEYEKIRSPKKIDRLQYLTDDDSLKNVVLELANYNDQGMFIDMQSLSNYDSTIPEFELPDHPEPVLSSINLLQATQECFLSTLDNYDMGLLIDELENSIQNLPFVFLTLYRSMIKHTGCLSDIVEYHAKQDKKTGWNLAKIN